MTWLASLWLCPIVVLKRYCADLCLRAINPCLPCLAELGVISLIKGPRTQDSFAQPNRSRSRDYPCGRYETSCSQKEGCWQWLLLHVVLPSLEPVMTRPPDTQAHPTCLPTRYQAPSVQSARHELPNYCTCVAGTSLVCLVSARA